jgi:hypothetical protein
MDKGRRDPDRFSSLLFDAFSLPSRALYHYCSVSTSWAKPRYNNNSRSTVQGAGRVLQTGARAEPCRRGARRCLLLLHASEAGVDGGRRQPDCGEAKPRTLFKMERARRPREARRPAMGGGRPGAARRRPGRVKKMKCKRKKTRF